MEFCLIVKINRTYPYILIRITFKNIMLVTKNKQQKNIEKILFIMIKINKTV